MNTAQPQTVNRGERSRALILDAAKLLILERGFQAVTVQDVLDAAGVTKGRFFHHFSSKEALFSELLRYALTKRDSLRFEDLIRDCPDKSPIKKLLYLVDRVIHFHRAGLPEEMRLCLFATFFFPPDSEEMHRINAIIRSNVSVLEKQIKEAQKLRELPNDLDPAVCALLFPSTSTGANVIGFLCGRKDLTPNSLIELRKMIVTLNKASVKGKKSK